MEIVKFYQEGRGDVWDKLGAMGGADAAYGGPGVDDSLQNPVRACEHLRLALIYQSIAVPSTSAKNQITILTALNTKHLRANCLQTCADPP